MSTLAEQLSAAQAKLAEYETAESEALQAQDIRVSVPGGGGDRSETMADLRDIRRGISYWRSRCAGLQARISGQPTVGGMTFTSARFGGYTSN